MNFDGLEFDEIEVKVWKNNVIYKFPDEIPDDIAEVFGVGSDNVVLEDRNQYEKSEDMSYIEIRNGKRVVIRLLRYKRMNVPLD